MASIPWRNKFRLEFKRDRKRFYFRALLGVFVFYVARQWEYLPWLRRRHSQVAIGWIPLKIEDGGLLQVWSPYNRVYPQVQTIWRHN